MTIGHEQEYQLRTGDFDCYGRVLPASVFDIFQDIAGVSAEQTPGMERDALLSRGLAWVVVRSMYETVGSPDLHERVIARTWPLAPTRMGFQRDYTIRALDDTVLVKGTSQWVMMDMEKRSFVSARDVYDGPSDFSTETAFKKKLKKIRPFDLNGAEVCSIEPTFTDIDVNGHVNNTKYANYVLDAAVLEKLQPVRTFQIDYYQEMRLGQKAFLHTIKDDETVKATALDEKENRLFAACITFG